MLGGKGGRLASRRTPSQLWSTGVAASSGLHCCRRDWCTSQNRWHHVEGNVCVYIEATSQDISLVANGSSKWTMTPSILPKLWQNGLRTTKSRYWSGQHKPWPQSYRKFVGRTEKACARKKPTNLTQLHQLCQEEWAKIHPTYCGKLVECYPKRLTQVKQFKGNATKY